jgi:hypothetical protein
MSEDEINQRDYDAGWAQGFADALNGARHIPSGCSHAYYQGYVDGQDEF